MDSLLNHFDLKIVNNHTAMGDVLALYEIIKKARPKLWHQVGEKKGIMTEIYKVKTEIIWCIINYMTTLFFVYYLDFDMIVFKKKLFKNEVIVLGDTSPLSITKENAFNVLNQNVGYVEVICARQYF